MRSVEHMVKPIYAFRYGNDICIAVTDRDASVSSMNELKNVKCQSMIYRYKGDLGVDLSLEVVDNIDYKCKIIRSKDEFLYYLKILYPMVHFNPIYLCNGLIVFDNPFVEVDGNNFCMWHPRFGIKTSMKYISQDDSCVVYHYEEPIFIYPYDYKRHTPATNEEHFSINYKTGVAIHSWKSASMHDYTEYASHFECGVWVQDYFNQKPITGWKKR